MFTARGVTVLCAGLAMWVVARIIGSPGLEVVGIGILTLPLLAAVFTRWSRQNIAARHHLSDIRVAPGTRVTVSVDVDNRSSTPTSFLLLEDRVPASLGRPARLVVSGIPPRSTQRVSYTVLPQTRGSYRLGPLLIDVSDPFALTRQRMEFAGQDELLVTPEIEDLESTSDPATGASFGASRARQLFRTGQEYYTMRAYQEGDDLRRIHWASVARTGELMIRQDESSRRANGLVFLDTRSAAVGQDRSITFERAVSVAATLGVLLTRRGFLLRVATAESQPTAVTEDRFLDTLAGVGHSLTRTIGAALGSLRAGASADTSLVFVSGLPTGAELPSIIRSAAGFGPKLAVLIYPADPGAMPPDRQAEFEGRATAARLSLSRSGWDCVVLPPSMRLSERWHTPPEHRYAHSG